MVSLHTTASFQNGCCSVGCGLDAATCSAGLLSRLRRPRQQAAVARRRPATPSAQSSTPIPPPHLPIPPFAPLCAHSRSTGRSAAAGVELLRGGGSPVAQHARHHQERARVGHRALRHASDTGSSRQRRVTLPRVGEARRGLSEEPGA